MAITCNFYSFSKRENSTARPSGSGTSFSCTLKEPTSIEAPTLELAIASPTFYDYAYIPSFDRYYYVTDWTYNRGVWEVTLAVDALATYKTEIGSSYIYVLRASAAYNKEIRDNLYPVQAVTHKQKATGTLYQWAAGLSQGTYIAYVNNGTFDEHNAYGSLNYMTFTPTAFTNLLKYMYQSSDVSWNNFPGLAAYSMPALSLVNPIDYITKVIWVPLSVGEGSYETFFGFYDSRPSSSDPIIPHGILSSFRRTQTVALTIPRRSDSTRGDWSDAEPFGHYYLHYAPFGVIPLNSAALIDAVTLNCTASLDLMTGDLKLTITTVGDHGSFMDIVYEGTANVAIEIPIDKAKSETARMIEQGMGLLTAAGDAVLGNYAGAMNDLQGSIGMSVGTSPKTATPPRGLLTIGDTITLYHEYYDFVDTDNTNKGRPLCEVRQISGLGGFMITNNGNISIPGTAGEKAAVRRYLEGGFYYE